MRYHFQENYDFPHILMMDTEDEEKFLYSSSKYKVFIGDGKPVLRLDIKNELNDMFSNGWDVGLAEVSSTTGRYTVYFFSFRRKQDATAWRLAKE